MKRLNITLLFICITLQSMGQISVDTCSCFFFDEFMETYITIKSYTITNNTDDDYVTWISYYPIDSISKEQVIHLYFNNRVGDFSMSFLLYENLLNSELTNRIGKTFLKRIKSKESFEYLITKKDPLSDYYERRVFYAPRKEVESYLKNIIPEDCFSTISALPLQDAGEGDSKNRTAKSESLRN